ncbi:Endonuclease/Exonuclease/phosphatase family protein [Phycisphaerae bacterium RAS1]|nr:Endonuclease/Exonuclease/phosphatase family protein [Phycisphaerae bacterium RAS1]
MRFRLMTYNIHKAIGVDRKFAPERIVAVLEEHDADIVLLQEVDRGHPRSDHLDLASYLGRELKYHYRAVGMNVVMKTGRYGNATLSRFPIGRQRNIDLTIGGRKRRGAQHTRIHLTDAARRHYYLDVFNVHLSLLAGLRRTQVQRLLTCPDMAALDESDACVVAGDTNDWRGLLRRQLAPAGFSCATTRRPGSKWAIRSYPSFAPTGGLDRVFCRGPLQRLSAHAGRSRVARVASDHLPVIVDFEIEPHRAADHDP